MFLCFGEDINSKTTQKGLINYLVQCKISPISKNEFNGTLLGFISYLFARVPIHKVKKSDRAPPARADKLKKMLENEKKKLVMVTISHCFEKKY